jgi:hypothetical protein
VLNIPFESQDFPQAYSLGNIGVLNTNWDDILWSALTVGRPNRAYVFQHSSASFYEAVFRCSLVKMAVRQNNPNSLRSFLYRTSAFRTLDPSEKGAINYFLGLTFCKLFAASLLNTPWLLHLDVFRSHFDIEMVLHSRSRPDLIGKENNSQSDIWHVFECKGRANQPSQDVLDKAKAQAQRLIAVNNNTCTLHIGTITHFREDVLNFYWIDPEPIDKSPVELTLTEKDWSYYYEPILGLITESTSIDKPIFDEEGKTIFIPQIDLRIGLHPKIAKSLLNKDYFSTMKAAENLSKELQAAGYRPDGLLIKAGESWRNEVESFKIFY